MARAKGSEDERAAARRLVRRLPKPTRAELEELNRLRRVEVLELGLLLHEVLAFVRDARSLREVHKRFGLPTTQGPRRDDREAFNFYAWLVRERPKEATEA